MSPMKSTSLICRPARTLFFLSLLTTVLLGCSSEPKSAAPAPETVHNVKVFTVRKAMVPDWLEAVGTLRAAQTSQLASQMMGNIVEIRVREGERVQRGQVLAVIDDAQPRAALDRATAAQVAAEQEIAAAESDFNLADATLKRYQDLYQKRSVSPQEFDEVKARYQAVQARRDLARAGQTQAKAAAAQARTSLEYSRIRAPFEGVITEKKADPGALASPGMVIFTIEDTRRYRLEASVDESDLRRIRIGQTSPVIIDALDNAELQGKVAQIVPAVDPASRSFLVKIELPVDARLRSGFFGRAHFARGERPSLLIPRTAVVERGQLQGVYVLDQNQVARLHYVTLGKSAGQQVEVLSGLEGGEKLIAEPGDRELGGKRVEAE